MTINFFDFEGRLCTAVPWQRKKIVRFFDYILRANPEASEKHLKEYVPMYVGDLRDMFMEEEIEYLKWMSSNIQLMQDMNNIIKATIKKTNIQFKRILNSIPSALFYNFGYNDFLEFSAEDILRRFQMSNNYYYGNVVNCSQELASYMNSVNRKNKYQIFRAIQEGGFYVISIFPKLESIGNLRFYLTVKPDKLGKFCLELAKMLAKKSHEKRERVDFKFTLKFRTDTIVIYSSDYIINSIKNLDDSWFLDFHMPFTKKIAKGRGVAIDITRDMANKLDINPEEELSNGNVLCILISRAFNEFLRKIKKYPSNEHENLAIILEACYQLFKSRINMHDIKIQ